MCVTVASSSCDCCKTGFSMCEASSSMFFNEEFVLRLPVLDFGSERVSEKEQWQT